MVLLPLVSGHKSWDVDVFFSTNRPAVKAATGNLPFVWCQYSENLSNLHWILYKNATFKYVTYSKCNTLTHQMRQWDLVCLGLVKKSPSSMPFLFNGKVYLMLTLFSWFLISYYLFKISNDESVSKTLWLSWLQGIFTAYYLRLCSVRPQISGYWS